MANNQPIFSLKSMGLVKIFNKQEESARERALCQLTECFSFVMVIMRGEHNYQGKGCTEIQ